MNTININTTVALSQDDRKLLENLMGSITLLASVLGNAQPAEVQQKIIAEVTEPQVAETHTTTEPAPIIEEPVAEPAPVADPTPEVKQVSLAEFQKAITLAVSKGAEAKQAVKAIINKYAPSVSAVPEDKRADIIAELSTI